MSVRRSACLPVSQSVSQPICLSACLSVCMYVYVYRYICDVHTQRPRVPFVFGDASTNMLLVAIPSLRLRRKPFVYDLLHNLQIKDPMSMRKAENLTTTGKPTLTAWATSRVLKFKDFGLRG